MLVRNTLTLISSSLATGLLSTISSNGRQFVLCCCAPPPIAPPASAAGAGAAVAPQPLLRCPSKKASLHHSFRFSSSLSRSSSSSLIYPAYHAPKRVTRLPHRCFAAWRLWPWGTGRHELCQERRTDRCFAAWRRGRLESWGRYPRGACALPMKTRPNVVRDIRPLCRACGSKIMVRPARWRGQAVAMGMGISLPTGSTTGRQDRPGR